MIEHRDARSFLQRCTPESVLEKEDATEYKQMIQAAWQNLLVLNANIHLLERIVAFPFEFLGVDPQPFWATIQRALLDGCVLAIWRIALDCRVSR